MSKTSKPRSCSVEDCLRVHIARGFCTYHYNIDRRNRRAAAGLNTATGLPRLTERRVPGSVCVRCEVKPVHAKGHCHSCYRFYDGRVQCSTPECTRPMHAQGLCGPCYGRAANAGDLKIVRPKGREIDERFDSKHVPGYESCSLWTDTLTAKGQGHFTPANQQTTQAHRFAWTRVHGPIPMTDSGRSLSIDHHCRVRHCVNPDHLEPVTSAENTRRGRVAAGTALITGQDMGWLVTSIKAFQAGAANFPSSVVTVRNTGADVSVEEVAA